MLSEEELIEARHKLAAGRILASRKMPYFTTALMAMSPHEREGLGTFAVDERWRMYYDPAKCLEWTVNEIAAVWLHEVGHVIRDHNARYKALEGFNHDPHLFNAAGDAAINSDLRETGILLPNPELRYYAEPNPNFPKWKKGMTAEEMYFIGRGTGKGKPPPEKNKGAGNPVEEESSEGKDDNGESSEQIESPPSEDKSTDENTEDNADDEAVKVGGDDSDEEPDDSKEKNSDVDSGKLDAGDGEADADSSEDSTESGDDDVSPNPTGESGESTDGDSGEDSDEGSDGVANEDGSGESDESESGDEGSGDAGDSDGSGDTDSGEGEGTDSDSPGDATGSGPPLPDCGSAVDGEPRDYEETDDNDGSVDKTAAETLKKKTAEAIIEYAKSNPGSVPGNLVREAENILDPQIDWRDEFSALIRHVAATHSGYSNYSYKRPSRRSSGSNFILPTMRNPPAPEIAIVLDTSGSMDIKKELALGLAEMEDIINRSARYSESQSIKIINCDSAAASVEVVRDLKDFEIVGGGGTDMRVGIKVAAELQPKVHVIITITDGFTPWPTVIPPENERAVYIALIVGGESHARSNSKRYSTVPPWMKVIEVNIPQKRKGYSIRR